jgi:hypothetical protein
MPYAPPAALLGITGEPPVDDSTPALYSEFASSLADVWARVTYRVDVIEAALGLSHRGSEPLFVLGFTEWVADPAYYGDWWRTGGIALYTEGDAALPSGQPWNLSGSAEAGGYRGTNDGAGSGSEVYDVRVQYLGTTVVAGVTKARFYTEVWHNGVKKYDDVWVLGVDSGKPLWTGVQALTIFNRDTASGTLYLDEISVGTARGASDVLAVQSFDGSYGDFSVDPGEMSAMTDSFFVTPAVGPVVYAHGRATFA